MDEEKRKKQILEEMGRKRVRQLMFSLITDKDGKSWTDKERINKLLETLKGTAVVYTITHKQGTEEEHQHFYIQYKNARLLSTVANLFNVENNFIQTSKNKKGSLRYLTHKDNPDKEQYEDSEVLTNSKKPYHEVVEIEEYTNIEIFNTLKEYGIQYTIDYFLKNGVSFTTLNQAIRLYQVYDKFIAREEVAKLKAENQILREQVNRKNKDIRFLTTN